MTFKGHISLAILPLAIYYQDNIFQTNNLIILGFVLLGAILPDIDEPNSYIGRKIPFISILLKDMFNIEHRTITHTIFIPLMIAIIAFSINNEFLLALSFGILMHDVGDMLTKGGVPIFYPFIKTNIRLLPKKITFYTASPVEYLLIILIWGIILFYLLNNGVNLL